MHGRVKTWMLWIWTRNCPGARANFQMVLEWMHRLCSTYLVSLLHDIEPKPAKTKSSFLCLQLCNAGVCCNLRSFKSCQRLLPISRADMEWSEWCMPFPQHRADSTGVSNSCEPICAPCPSSDHGVPTTSNRRCSQMFPNVASVSEWTTKNAEELCPRTQSCKQLPTENTSKWNSYYTFLWLHKKTSSQTSVSWLVTHIVAHRGTPMAPEPSFLWPRELGGVTSSPSWCSTKTTTAILSSYEKQFVRTRLWK